MNSALCFIASDHAGFDLKEKIKKFLTDKGQTVIDLGPETSERVDFPDFANLVAKKIQHKEGRGILVCGSGQGMAMRANKFSNVRAALCWNEESCRLSREHNDSNLLCLGSRLIDHDLALKLIPIFLDTPFASGRHATRVDKISHPTDDSNDTDNSTDN